MPSGDERVASLAFLIHASFPTSRLKGWSPGYAWSLGIVKETGLFLAKRGSNDITFLFIILDHIAAVFVYNI